MFFPLDKKCFRQEKCRNISVAYKQYSLNNKSQKDIRKVIETINNKEEREYIGIFTTVLADHILNNHAHGSSCMQLYLFMLYFGAMHNYRYCSMLITISGKDFTASGGTQGAAQDFSFFGQNSREHL